MYRCEADSTLTVSPQKLTSPQTPLSLQAVATVVGDTFIRATIPATTPVVIGSLNPTVFPLKSKAVTIHIIRDTAGHDASTLISPSDIQNIMTTDTKNVKSAWSQVNINLEPYGITTLPTFTADIVTVSTPFGASVVFANHTSPDYVNILAAAPPNPGINLYYVPGLNGGAADGLTIPGSGVSLISAGPRVSRSHVTSHEIGHSLGIQGAIDPINHPCGPPAPDSDYCEANRTYELMYWRTGEWVGPILTYTGFTITPAQGRIVHLAP